MEELKELLENYFIQKSKDKELYYSIKDGIKNFKSFITDKLGYTMIVRNDFIKLEKLPGIAESWMGIEEFKDKNEYVFLLLILMFLEDKSKEEQFLLSHAIDYISANSISGTVEWTDYKIRRQLVTVMKFCIKLQLFIVNEEEEKDFAQNETTEALYENTGLSKYLVRSFPMDMMKCRDYKDIEDYNKDLLDSERGFVRRNRVYRRLLLSPIVYNEGATDEDYDYIKKGRSRIEEDFNHYLDWTLHVHKNGALMVPAENENLKNSFPSTAGISDVVLNINKMLYGMVKTGDLKRQTNDLITLSEEDFKELLHDVKVKKGHGWSKEYRECSEEKLYTEVISYMSGFSMLQKSDELCIYPLVSKVIGDYPKDYPISDQDFSEAAIGKVGDGDEQ